MSVSESRDATGCISIVHRPPTLRIEPGPVQGGVERRAHALHEGQQRLGENRERWSRPDVRAADDGDPRRTLRGEKRGEDGLQHQNGTARRADIDGVGPRHHPLGHKRDGIRSVLDWGDVGLSNRGGRLEGRDVLGAQAGAQATGPDVDEPDGLLTGHGQRQRGPDDLAAALPHRPVDPNRVVVAHRWTAGSVGLRGRVNGAHLLRLALDP